MSVLVGKIAVNKCKCMSIYTASVCVFGSLYDECGGGDWICPTKGNRNTSPKKLAKNSGTIGGRTAPPDHADHLLRRSCRYMLHGGDHQTIPDWCQSPAYQLPPHQLRWQEPLYETATDPPTPAWADTHEKQGNSTKVCISSGTLQRYFSIILVLL